MNFPLPQVKQENIGLLREVRTKRKYESENKKKSKFFSSTSSDKTSKNENNKSNSYCLISITGIGGAIIIIVTIIFTVMEILNNKNTSIIAYPVSYTGDNNIDGGDNNENIIESQINSDYVYPRISLDEVRAEIQKARMKETEKAKEMIRSTLETQLSLIPSDFPSDANFAENFNLINTYFKDTEFYKRYRTNGDTEWFNDLSSSIAIYDHSNSIDLYSSKLQICVHIINHANGYGFRNWRDGQLHFMTDLMGDDCTLAIHWGWLDICPKQPDGLGNAYNIFEILFYCSLFSIISSIL